MSYNNIKRDPKIGDIVTINSLGGKYRVYTIHEAADFYGHHVLDCVGIVDINDGNDICVSSIKCVLLSYEQIHMFEEVLCEL